MKQGDWVKIEFLGKVKATGEVFDLTSEKDAKENGIYDEKKTYGPALVIVGGGMIMPGVEKQLLGMKAGEEKEFDVQPKDAMGPRAPSLVKIMSYPKFVKQNINPVPGMWINIDGRNCLIKTVSGGRVMVDFNHPLAGKELRYRLKVTEQIKEPLRMVEELMAYYKMEGKASVSAAGKKAVIKLEEDTKPLNRKLVEETLKKWCPGVDKVEFPERSGKKEEPGKPAGQAAAADPTADDAGKN